MSRLFLICALVALVGCKGSTAPLLPSPVGSYVLTTVDSKPLPAQQTAGDSILTGGAVIYANGAYAINWLAPSYYFGTRSEIAARDTGVWTGSAGQMSFASTSGASWTGDFAAPSLTVHLAHDTWTFVKP
ncbi:MAG TPA: hypothetical protein VJW73_08285 [Gemmatimonadaceae bacterium]|nr:hypothetical protein [Gemmatimonadaceae bacterium]